MSPSVFEHQYNESVEIISVYIKINRTMRTNYVTSRIFGLF